MLQPVIQKLSSRLPGWNMIFFSYHGREILVKSILSVMPTFFLSIFKMPKWAFAKMDRIRRSFLWKGQDLERVKGGHYLVNWQACLRPKKWGGIGIKDLDKFSRALRLRWLWHHWDHIAKPWKSLLRVTDKLDKHLFFCSTTIQIVDGKNTPFWKARWLQGLAPKDLAPNLYKLARFKSRSVHTELTNLN
jgi:hypothetical protein